MIAQTKAPMETEQPATQSDEFDLQRFVSAQEHTYAEALWELKNGRKESHWMWFIFPQVEGLGTSPTARHYAIKSASEARAFLEHALLGPRLVECCHALLAVNGKSASEIMGYPDDLKLRSSMTLFSLIDPSQPEFTQVLDKYFESEPDARTVDLLGTMRG